MQTLAQQQASMSSTIVQPLSGQIGFYDVLGSNSMSSFKMSKQVTIASDKQSVSIAGENSVLPGSGVTISVNLSDVLLSTAESGIAFKLTCLNGGYVKNASKIFECLSYQIGSIDVQQQNSKYYQAQLLNTSSYEEVQQYAMGELATYKVDKVSNLLGQQLNVVGGGNPAVIDDYSGIHEYVSSLYSNFKRSVIGVQANAAAAHEAYCFVPFIHLANLRDIPALYLGMGQRLVLNLRLVPSGEALMHAPSIDGGEAPSYTISQAHGVYVYSILDAPRKEQIMRSNVSPIAIVKNVSFQQIAQQTLALQVPISKGQYVRRLLISLHPTTQSIQAAANTNALANAPYFSAAAGKAKAGPLNSSILFGLEFLQVQVGAQMWTLRQQQLKYLQTPMSGQITPYADRTMFNHNYCLEIDLTRFSDLVDALGSLGDQQSQITINLQYSDDPVMPGQTTGANGLLANLGNFFAVVNVECIQYMQCSSGIYSMI